MDSFNVTFWNAIASHGYSISDDGTQFCEQQPHLVSSFGVWEKYLRPSGLGMLVWDYDLPQLEAVIVIVLCLWNLFYFLLKKIRLPVPRITSMMLAGAALSQTSLLPNDWLVQRIFFPDDLRPKLPDTLGAFAFVLYWFLEGVKMDVGMIRRTGSKAVITGIVTVLFPIFTANIVFGSLRETGGKNLTGVEYRTMIFMQSISAFTGISRLIRDLEIDHSEFGRIVLSTAMVADATGVGINVVALFAWSDWRVSAMQGVGVLGYIIVLVWVFRPLMLLVVRRTPEERPVKECVIYSILILSFFSFYYLKMLHFFPAIGPFLLGLCVPHGPPLGSALIQKFESFNTGILLPLFLFFPMLQIDGPWLVEEVQRLRHYDGQMYEALTIIVVVSAAKIFFSTIPPLLAKMPLTDSFVMSLILSNKGFVEMCYFMYAVEKQTMHVKSFTTMALMILFSSTVLPVMIHYLYDGSKRFICFQKRNLMSLKLGSEMKFLTCIHKSDHIAGVINFLEQFFPLEDSTLTCYVLNLIELVGLDNPLFISHQMQKAEPGHQSYSTNVLIAFEKFKHYWKAISVELFTSISIPKFMHQEIYSLALDKQASFIMLPFHKIWSLDQTTVVSDDIIRRKVNINVLKQAPCSVGILVHRQKLVSTQKRKPYFKVCAIFVGGKDDREALAMGKHMMRNPKVRLTVLKLIPGTLVGMTTGWDQMLDTAELKETLRYNSTHMEGEQNFVEYLEETVDDGADTSRILLSISSVFDLFVVGRSTGMGTDVTRALSEFTEFDELANLRQLSFNLPIMEQHAHMDYLDVAWRGYKEDKNTSLFCETHPFTLNSHGIWERLTYKSGGMSFWEYPLPNLEIIILSTFVLWRLFEFSCNKIGLRVPRFTHMMIAGVILGKTFNFSNTSWLHNIYFPDDRRPKIPETLAAFGFLLYWFLKGVTMDAGTGLRMGKKASVIGFTTMFVPLVCGNIIFRLRKRRGNITLLTTEYRLLMFLQSISAFTSIDTLLRDLKIKHSEFGRIALSGAMVTDMLAFIATFLNAMHYERYDGLVQTVFSCFFFTVMVCVVRPAMYWVIKQTPEGRPVKDIYIYLILALAFFSFKYFEMIGLFGPAGSFVLGLTVPHGYPLGATFVQKFESFNLGVIFPLFGSLTMMQLDLPWLFKECGNLPRMEGQLYEAISLVLLVNVSKFIASTIAAYAFKMPLRDSFALALVYSNKGVFELSYFTYAVEIKKVTPEVFTIIATIIFLNSLFIPMALELVHDPTKRFRSYQKRNMVILKDGAELQSLVCIYKPDHITSMISLSGAFNPSEDSPMACNVLHLIELMGQASPMFISHQLQQPEPGSISCSDSVISSFRHFHKNFFEYISLNIFTSVSMSKHMHEDICWLALSRSLYLILLPFHRTWSADRSTIISNDDKLRMININVLRRAPCSVGIFVYRKPITEHHLTEYHSKICLIFNDGKDDREALAITNRMRLTEKRISLTIIRFIPKISEMENQNLGGKFEMVSLKDTVTNIIGFDVKENDDYVTYIDRTVSDGSDTSKILRAMGNDHDLFVVGKSSGVGTDATNGITEWAEFDELGPLGDLLASHEFPSRASVLVVQKQEYIHSAKSKRGLSK
ncbi:unnamed protein product [Eruca vesicaria subsp. sativa]|uniref:Cation/H+ exchanger domain-containing protein n=1 Tax=Eruca vesicaria subsp. sativa TaxID=29727 RepID=A0ABC8LK25_ERUVS|nr:unnamed protein product [Eruca vesicaria subsp. sativa]